MTPEDTARIQATRAKVLADPAWSNTPEGRAELTQAIAILRSDRVSASIGSSASRTARAEAAKPVDTGAVLANLKALGAGLASGVVKGA
jgi:hypothetical protein